jgi:hypothetical protein
MMYIELKIESARGVFTRSFKVVEIQYSGGKPNHILSKRSIYSGSILECEAFVRLRNSNILI